MNYLEVQSFCPSCQWNHTTEVAIEKGIPVLTLDLYGRGFSDNPDTAYTLELFANQVIQLLDFLEIDEKVNIAGPSMGGAVLAQIAAHHPNRINKLIFVAPQGFSDLHSDMMPNENRQVTHEETSNLILNNFPGRAEGQLEDFYNKEGLEYWVDLYRPLLLHKHFARALISTKKNFQSMKRENIMIGLYDFPVHFIWGDHDEVLPLEEGRYNALNWIPRAQLHIVESCGHLPHIEKTEEFDHILFEKILK